LRENLFRGVAKIIISSSETKVSPLPPPTPMAGGIPRHTLRRPWV